jgi:peptidyl-dipeptidase Dcp
MPMTPSLRFRRAAPGFAALLLMHAPLPTFAQGSAASRENPLLTESTLPFHYPRFDQVKDEDYVPAFEQGMAQQLRETDAIAANPGQPTFENTIVALERSGQLLARTTALFSNLKKVEGNAAKRKIDSAMAPRLAAHTDAIHLNAALFSRIEVLYHERADLGLDPESKRLLERYEDDFVRAGARLSPADQGRLKAMNTELASLTTTFSQNVLNERNASSVVFDQRSDLAGLSEAEIAVAAADAKASHQDGKFLIKLVNTTGQPVLASLTNRAVRQRIMEASLARGTRGGPFDNQAVLVRMARLRAEQAALLGYPDFAAYRVANQTARTVVAVNNLLGQLTPPALANAHREAAEMQAIIDREHGGFQLAAWDWDFYSEKVRQAKYSFDESRLRPYFELNRVLVDGVFYAANRLYGLTFKERHDLPVYRPDVRVFEVFDRDGQTLAFFLEDFYARPSKEGGAWMNQYVPQTFLLDHHPIVANHHNIPKPAPGEPTLLTFDEVTTLFHEFGHGLHGMFSKVRYPLFAGTNVPRDFVEYPSQVNEMWAAWPEIVRHYAKDYRTGAPMPEALLDKMLATRKFNQGFVTSEHLGATILDQAWHQLGPDEVPGDVPALEAATRRKSGTDFDAVPPRYRSAYFSHVFAGGYAADYYSYIWADVLVADSIEWFTQHGGLLRANGDHFRAAVLSNGDSRDVLGQFRTFTGGDPDVAPLLWHRGLVPVTAAPGT